MAVNNALHPPHIPSRIISNLSWKLFLRFRLDPHDSCAWMGGNGIRDSTSSPFPLGLFPLNFFLDKKMLPNSVGFSVGITLAVEEGRKL